MVPNLFKHILYKPKFGFLGDSEMMDRAIDILKKGGVIGFQMGPVYGLGIDAENVHAQKKLNAIKGESKILSALMLADQLHKLIKISAVDPRLKGFVENSFVMEDTFGCLTFLGVPVDSETAKKFNVPQSLLSSREGIYFLHGLMPNGHSLMTEFMKKLRKNGINYFGVSSMNKKGQKEITDEAGARKFVKEEGIKILSIDELHNIGEGSYPIIDFTNGKIVRAAGFIHQDVLHALVKFQLDTSSMKLGNYNPIEHPLEILDPAVSSAQIRAKILNLLYTIN